MTKRERLIAYGLKRGFLSEEDAVDLLDDPDFYPEGDEQVDRKPSFIDGTPEFFRGVKKMVVNIATARVAEMLVDVLSGMTGKTAYRVCKLAMKYLS